MAIATEARTTDLDAVFKALASSHRREILPMLSAADGDGAKTCCAAEEVCACKISERLGAVAVDDISPHVGAARCWSGCRAQRRDLDVLHAAA